MRGSVRLTGARWSGDDGVVTRSSDVAWEKFGSTDPYYGVLTEDRYRGDLDDEARAEFFASGEQHVETMFETIRRTVHPGFAPTRAMDFGCGVGRVAIPLAERCAEEIGVDISPSMLAEARENARGLSNVAFAVSDDDLTAVGGRLDFVHSFIVFQHMPVGAGMSVLTAMLRLLDPGGVGALHFTYARDIGVLHRVALKAVHTVPGMSMLLNFAQRRPLRTPLMQMNDYDLGDIAAALQRAGCSSMHVELTDHYGHMGAFVYFRKG
jgi:SAM-dependent methyltransferase